MATDPRRLFDAKDIQAAGLYAKRVVSDLADLYPVLVDEAGNLCVNMTVGTVSLSSTASVITNAVGNPVPVSLSNTKVTIDNTVAVTGTFSPTTTESTINNSAANPVNVSLASTVVTCHLSPSTTKVTIESTLAALTTTERTVVLSATAVTISIGRTLTGSTGSLSATNGTLFTPTNRAKVYAFSLTTTSASEVICVFHSGGLELWRVALMAVAGVNSGANLAVAPPGFLFASRSGTAVSLSLSTAVMVHYSVSCFDEI